MHAVSRGEEVAASKHVNGIVQKREGELRLMLRMKPRVCVDLNSFRRRYDACCIPVKSFHECTRRTRVKGSSAPEYRPKVLVDMFEGLDCRGYACKVRR
jgi:hypothetical protein